MQELFPLIAPSACPHDCPSASALEVPIFPMAGSSGFMGARNNTYPLGVVCAKVARYAERIEQPDWLLKPLRRT
jgi:anaerobic selenocysteine-containing dehydrogenase